MNNSKGINIHVRKSLNKSALPFLFFLLLFFTEILNIPMLHLGKERD